MIRGHLHRGGGSGSPQPSQRTAYTLIELLIAAVLVAALMTVVWGMMSMYNSYLTAGQGQAAEQQLVRSLFQLLMDDLQSVSLPRGASGIRRSVAVIPGQPELNGTRNVLRVTARRSEQRRSGDPRIPASDGFRTIVYQYHSPLAGTEGLAAMPAGLYRLEADSLGLQVLLSQQEEMSRERTDASDGSATISPHLSRDTLESLLLPPVTGNSAAGDDDNPRSDRPRLERIPEVVSCRFQYFADGEWYAEWDSRLRQSLPAAVRIRLRLASPDDVAGLDQLTPGDDTGTGTDTGTGLIAAAAESTGGEVDAAAEGESRPTSLAAPWQNFRTRSHEFVVLLGLPTPNVSLREGEADETDLGAMEPTDSGTAEESP